MSIISSDVTVESAQKDGRCWVRETHTDNIGLKWIFHYLADADTDYNAVLVARGITCAAQLIASEISNNLQQVKTLGSLAMVTTNYMTLANQAPFLRAAYAGMTQLEAVMTGDYLNTFSNAGIAAAFNITTGQAATLRTNKLVPAAAIAADIRANSGA